MAIENYLIVGLGNPGRKFENTRHNVGARIVRTFARRHEVGLRKKRRIKGRLGSFFLGDKRIYLLVPVVFMNESGEAVKLALDFLKVSLPHLLIVVDDADICLGELRLRENSGTGGHKGLESVESILNTNKYPRLKFGIGRKGENLVSYVLSSFAKEEEEKVKEIIENAIDVLELWIKEGILKAMNKANVRIGEKNK